MVYCKDCQKIFFKYLYTEDSNTYRESLMRVVRGKCQDFPSRPHKIDYDFITCEVIKEEEYVDTITIFCPECKSQEKNGGNVELFNTIGKVYSPPREVVEAFEFVQSLIHNEKDDYVDVTKLSLEEVVEVEKAFKVLRDFSNVR